MNSISISPLNFCENTSYYAVDNRTGCMVSLGKCIKANSFIELERVCWHEGPIYDTVYSFEFDGSCLDKEMMRILDKVKFEYVKYHPLLKHYSFYEMPPNTHDKIRYE